MLCYVMLCGPRYKWLLYAMIWYYILFNVHGYGCGFLVCLWASSVGSMVIHLSFPLGESVSLRCQLFLMLRQYGGLHASKTCATGQAKPFWSLFVSSAGPCWYATDCHIPFLLKRHFESMRAPLSRTPAVLGARFRGSEPARQRISNTVVYQATAREVSPLGA